MGTNSNQIYNFLLSSNKCAPKIFTQHQLNLEHALPLNKSDESIYALTTKVKSHDKTVCIGLFCDLDQYDKLAGYLQIYYILTARLDVQRKVITHKFSFKKHKAFVSGKVLCDVLILFIFYECER